MTFLDWWREHGLKEYTARVNDVVITYHDCAPETISLDDAEWVAKHCAWQTWMVAKTQQAAEMTKVA